MKKYFKIVILASMLGGIVFFEIIRRPVPIKAVNVPAPTVAPTLTPTMTPTMTPTPIPTYTQISPSVPRYSLGKYSGNEYAKYIWEKWAPHGNRAQAVALCTNIAEGHLDDNATGYNTDGTDDRGCWQFNSVHNLPDDLIRNCKKATDYTYNIWLKRMSLGVPDGFQGMWYGYESNNYNLCMKELAN